MGKLLEPKIIASKWVNTYIPAPKLKDVSRYTHTNIHTHIHKCK